MTYLLVFLLYMLAHQVIFKLLLTRKNSFINSFNDSMFFKFIFSDDLAGSELMPQGLFVQKGFVFLSLFS